MKKLALAPAVALAITGLAASPVMAAPSAPAPTQVDTQPASKTGVLQKTAVSSQTAVNAQAGTIGVSADSVTVEEFAENGVGIAGEGLTPETEYALTVAPADGQSVETFETTVTTDAEGAFEFAVEGVGAANPAFIGNYTVTVTNPEDAEDTATTSFEVTGAEEEPEAPEVDPKVSVNTDEISVSDFEENGLEFTGEGFTPNSAITIIGAAPQSPFYQDEVTADEDGKISTTVTAPDSGLEPGDYSVYAVDTETEQSSNYAKFTVTEDETEEPKPTTPAAEAELTVSPETINAADFVKEDQGVTLAVENCEPGSDVHYVVTPKGNSNVTAYDNTVQADDEGNASVNVYGTSANDPSAYLGDYDVTVTCGDDEMTGAFTVGEDANAGGSDGNEDGNEDGNGNGDNGDEDGNGNGGSELPRTGTELTGLVGGAALLLIGGAAVTMTMRRKKVAQDPAEI